jgi:hypothetical protein
MGKSQTVGTKWTIIDKFDLRKIAQRHEAKRRASLPSSHAWRALKDVRQAGLRIA